MKDHPFYFRRRNQFGIEGRIGRYIPVEYDGMDARREWWEFGIRNVVLIHTRYPRAECARFLRTLVKVYGHAAGTAPLASGRTAGTPLRGNAACSRNGMAARAGGRRARYDHRWTEGTIDGLTGRYQLPAVAVAHAGQHMVMHEPLDRVQQTRALVRR